MPNQSGKNKSILILIPVFGIVLFITLYIIASLLYPGGSQFDKNSVGFSWINNYWCNLLFDNAINGSHNPAKPVAMSAMVILCITLSYFWFLFPININSSRIWKFIIPFFGTLSMITGFLLFTSLNHDLIINLASSFGLVALLGAFIGLYNKKWFGLFALGVVNIIMIGLNNYFYYTPGLIIYLPVIQKITFASFLFWFCCIDIKFYSEQRKIIT